MLVVEVGAKLVLVVELLEVEALDVNELVAELLVQRR